MDQLTAKRMVRTLGVFHFLFAALFLLFAGFIFYALPGLSGSGRDLSMLGARGIIVGALCLLIAALYAVVGIGIWRLRSWGRVLAIILFSAVIVGGLLFAIINFTRANISLGIQALLDAAIAGFFLWLFAFQKDMVVLFKKTRK